MLYFLVLLFETVFCDASYAYKPYINKNVSKPEIITCNAKSKEAKIEVLNSRINIARSFEIELTVNDEIVDAGNCSDEPLLGLLKKNENGLWDTIVNIRNRAVGFCGIGNKVWNNDTIRVPFNTWKPVDQIEGLYSYTFITYKRGKEVIKNSNDFEIVYIPYENPNVGSNYGNYDTAHIGLFIFHHLRVFTGVNLEEQEIWERLRIQERYSSEYLFDKVFTYRTNRSSPSYFSSGDYNLDGNTDFRLFNSYYLYNPIKATFDYNEILSNACSIDFDKTNNTLTAYYNMTPPLGEASSPVKEATFKLPSLQFISGLNYLRNAKTGLLNNIDSSQLIFPISIETPFTPTQPSIEILYGSNPLIMTDKKHYFVREKVDTVFLISNGYGKLSEPSKLRFILEKVNVATNKWREYLPYIPLNDKIVTQNENGYCLPISVIYYVSNTEFAGGLQPGRYRCKVYDNERLIATSPDFFVHDEFPR